MNVYEFAKMLTETTGHEVRGFQSFAERPEEKEKMESILAEHGTLLEIEQFLGGEIKPAGVLVLYLNPASPEAHLYELSAEVSEKWRQLPKTANASVT
ncbi:MAG: hypothetical protein ABSB15_20600 [Bryobacteraceae bacterium]|jgi:hypothetical protein